MGAHPATTVEAEPGRPDWRAAVPVIIAIFVAARLVILGVASLTEYGGPIHDATKAFSSAPFLSGLTSSDGVWYLGIARDGYHAGPVIGAYADYVFFPLYPIVVRVASLLTLGDVTVAGLLVANLAALAAMILLYRVSAPRMGHRDALWAVGFLAFAPGAVAFAMAYSDSLFLLLALAAIAATRGRRDAAMGILFGLAALTRLPGVLLGIPLLVALIDRDGRRPSRGWAWLLLGPLALLLFSGYLWQLTGDPIAFLHGQAAWNGPTPPPVLGGPVSTRAEPYFLLLVGVILAYTFMLVYLRPDRIPRPEAALAILALVTVLVSGRTVSAPRYLAVAWPFAWIQAGSAQPLVPDRLAGDPRRGLRGLRLPRSDRCSPRRSGGPVGLRRRSLGGRVGRRTRRTRDRRIRGRDRLRLPDRRPQ